jgi:hypothetical protein
MGAGNSVPLKLLAFPFQQEQNGETAAHSKYIIDGLTMHLHTWEDERWIDIKNAPLFKKAAHLLQHRSAKMTLKWVKGHDGILGNEESDHLMKQGASKPIADELDLEIPIEFDLQGAKLTTLTQATVYRGIMERKNLTPRNSATHNLQLTRDTIQHITGDLESDATIWLSVMF